MLTTYEIIRGLDRAAARCGENPDIFEAIQLAAMRLIDAEPADKRDTLIDAFIWNRFDL